MNPTSAHTLAVTLAVFVALALSTSCTAPDEDSHERSTGARASARAPATTSGSGTPSAPPKATAAAPTPSDGRPVRGRLSIPAIGLTNLEVVPYRGWTDDAPGTEIQNNGRAASPHGPRGGTGPGGIGNHQVTAHRLSSTRAFLRLPELGRGDRIFVRASHTTYVYRITSTRRTSFRSAASLRAQRAAVPGRPHQEATRAMITLSTCATPEDHADGNYWSDEFDNPEHRIDKIGVLVAVR